MPPLGRFLATAALAAAALAWPAAAGAQASEAPAALRCGGDLARAPRTPVLLIHGTGVTAEENWAWGYAKALRDRGHGVCTIDLPQKATVDMQDSVLFTVAAIREVARRGGRRIATVGHSQGAAQAVLALRAWPSLAPLVDDVIGLSGAYDRGSDAIAQRCARRCIAPFWQFRPGSHLLAALARRPPPPGPSFTAIGTLYDTVVTPQPQANAVPGGRSMEIQDVCPGRRFAGDLDHIHMAADAVAYALAVDALDHPGPADPRRVSPVNCALDVFPGADPVRLATLAPALARSFQGEGSAPEVDGEPPLRCPLLERCGSDAPVLSSARLARRRVRAGRPIALVVGAQRTGRVRLRFMRRGAPAGTSPSVAVAPGAALVRIPARTCRSTRGRRSCRRVAAGRYAVTVEARGAPGERWQRAARGRPDVVR